MEGMNSRKSWVKIAMQLPLRNPKQCRDRYVLHLSPSIKKDKWTAEEDALIIQLYNTYGSKWAYIASQMPGRSDNAIKNRFNGFLQRQLHNKRIVYSNDALCMKLKQKPSIEKSPIEKILNKQLKQRRLEKLVTKYLQKSKPSKQVEQAICISDSENSGIPAKIGISPVPEAYLKDRLVPLYHVPDNQRVSQLPVQQAPVPVAQPEAASVQIQHLNA
jgi:hypothetical protein